MKRISPAVFGLALICFVLPWVNFSCGGQRIASFTGLELATGTTVQQPGTFGQHQAQKVDAEPLAVAVLVCTVLGLGLSFVKGKNLPALLGIVGVGGLILHLLLKSKIETDAMKQGSGAIQTDYAIGYWLVLLLFIAAIGLNGYLYYGSKGKAVDSTPQT